MKFWQYFFLSGLIITLVGLTINLSQQQEYKWVAAMDGPSSDVVTDHDGNVFRLPFKCEDLKVKSEKYPSGAAKSHTATLVCLYNGQSDTLCVSENHPARYYQYSISLLSIGTSVVGARYVEFRVTESRAELVVYIGLVMLLVCSLGWLIVHFPKESRVGRWLMVVALMVLVTVIVVVINPMLQTREVPPILRSVWFIPHVVSYIFSYALLIAGCFTAIYASWVQKPAPLQWSKRLLKSGTGFYTIGLALGIIWARSAWGTFWNWDPKETLALITYGYYLIICVATRYVSYLENDPQLGPMGKNPYGWNFFMQFFGLILLIICWVGPQLFFNPGDSLHSY